MYLQRFTQFMCNESVTFQTPNPCLCAFSNSKSMSLTPLFYDLSCINLNLFCSIRIVPLMFKGTCPQIVWLFHMLFALGNRVPLLGNDWFPKIQRKSVVPGSSKGESQCYTSQSKWTFPHPLNGFKLTCHTINCWVRTT